MNEKHHTKSAACEPQFAKEIPDIQKNAVGITRTTGFNPENGYPKITETGLSHSSSEMLYTQDISFLARHFGFKRLIPEVCYIHQGWEYPFDFYAPDSDTLIKIFRSFDWNFLRWPKTYNALFLLDAEGFCVKKGKVFTNGILHRKLNKDALEFAENLHLKVIDNDVIWQAEDDGRIKQITDLCNLKLAVMKAKYERAGR